MATKLTNATVIATVIETVKALEVETLGGFAKTEVLEKLEKVQAGFEKKSVGGERKPTARQIENEGIKGRVLEIFKAEPNRLFTITELVKALDDDEMSNQRMSAIVRQMYIAEGTVKRIEEKRKAYFTLA